MFYLMETIKVNINNNQYEIEVQRKKVTSVRIKVSKIGKITIVAPHKTPTSYIYEMIQKHYDWIEKTVNKVESNSDLINSKELLSLDKFWLFGKLYDLEITTIPKLYNRVYKDKIYVQKQPLPKIYQTLRTHYQLVVEEIFKISLKTFNQHLGTNFNPELSFRTTKGRYGCCWKSENRIQLTSKLIHYDQKEIELICFHELCHLIVSNHQREFYKLLEQFVPNHLELKKQMSNKGLLMQI